MKTITASYPLALINLDFLMIGTKNDSNKKVSVLVVMDHFTRYADVYVHQSKQHQQGLKSYVRFL